eukprot:TRINITY_DN5984_c0_g1_i1.p1 TRINITY_DN5984_c0_g1~~TRINITY_DN5984_c0_g1_i1.p1  ORF type:complete len:439 (-),score=77.82 TRINITY_DN5984_c0_g1_i1:15-1139(-)
MGEGSIKPSLRITKTKVKNLATAMVEGAEYSDDVPEGVALRVRGGSVRATGEKKRPDLLESLFGDSIVKHARRLTVSSQSEARITRSSSQLGTSQHSIGSNQSDPSDSSEGGSSPKLGRSPSTSDRIKKMFDKAKRGSTDKSRLSVEVDDSPGSGSSPTTPRRSRASSAHVTSKSKGPSKGIFGTPIHEILEREGGAAPYVVRRCVEDLKERGNGVSGLFTVPPNQKHVETLTARFESGKEVSFDGMDVHATGGILKKFLRESPPLFGFDNYPRLLELHAEWKDLEDTDVAVYKTKSLISALPSGNRSTLRYLFQFFAHLNETDPSNMTLKRLAMVFGSLLMRPRKISVDALDELIDIYDLFGMVLTERSQIFR